MCLLKYVLNLNRIFRFSYFDPDYPTSGLTVTELSRVYCIFLSLLLADNWLLVVLKHLKNYFILIELIYYCYNIASYQTN
jgi:hypothetical protein